MPVPEHLQPYALESKFDRGELTVWVSPENLLAACRILKNDLHFVRLSDVTAVDWFPREPRYEVVYHLHCLERKERMRLKVRMGGENPQVDSATAVWRSANWYEREVFDLFGIQFRNHPDPRRIMMPDEWVGHPLRKDYPVEGYK